MVKAGHVLVKKSPAEGLEARCDSFVVETHVHYPTDIAAGSDGLCILANFSEQFSLSDEEREELTRTMLEHVAGRVPVIVTTTHYGTQVCADGLHGFRYLRISLDALASDAPLAQPSGEVRISGVSMWTAYTLYWLLPSGKMLCIGSSWDFTGIQTYHINGDELGLDYPEVAKVTMKRAMSR